MGTDVTKTFTTLERLWDQYDVFGVRTMNKKIVVIGGGAAG